ncbi:hypothetical protein RFI_06949 [Reticulomyxa filosa]|uniref:SAM domain-containing protein n=1 Tax=Reticulomyxa filosa TaxID=46433 RepID=X6NVY3_RETFI|nr:hypothetical protein RFI_06949 [Reticulomyxa filosa]|eukprot:ETO30171.1 hypothetical protein RFI_06949 [Reticulomyxa filosa]
MKEKQVFLFVFISTPTQPFFFLFLIEISAKTRIGQLEASLSKLETEKKETEEKMEELLRRPKIGENEMIITKEEHENLTKELGRLAEQVDRLEESLAEAKKQAVPAQEVTAKMQDDEVTKQYITLYKFLNELEEKKRNNPSFAVDRNVKQWREEEVCFWMNQIGFGEYVQDIREKKIFGDILVTDMDNDMLSRELGVKRIHINSILREIQELKKRAFGYLEESQFVLDISYAPGSANMEPRAVDRFREYETNIGQLKQQLATLTTQLEEVSTVSKSTSDQKEDLQKEVATLQTRLQEKDTQLAASQSEIEHLKELSTKALALQAQEKIEELNKKVEEANNDFEKSKTQLIETYENNKKQLQSQIDAMTLTQNELKQNLENKEKECHSLSIRVEELEQAKGQRDEIERKETNYLDSLKQKAEQDPLFANPKKANKWTLEEVSLWLFRINSKEYIDAFKAHRVDGSMLLNDLKTEELTKDIGVQTYHVGKIMREIQKLKENAEAILVCVYIICLIIVCFVCKHKLHYTVSNFFDLSIADQSLGLDPNEVKQLRSDLENQVAINEALRTEIAYLEREMKETPGGPGQSIDEHDEAEYGERDRGVGTVVVRQPSMDDVKREHGSNNTNNATAAAQVKRLEEEITRIEISKINLAIALNEQIEYLRYVKIDLDIDLKLSCLCHRRICVRVLMKEYEHISGTPFGLNSDPVMSVLNYFGLEKTQRNPHGEGQQRSRRL